MKNVTIYSVVKSHKKVIQNMSKWLLVISTCILAASCGGQTPRLPVDDPSPQPKQSSVPACTNCSGVVFMGDSIFGRLVSNSSFVNAGYIDSGVFGERTDEMLARFPDVISGQNVCHGFIPPAGQPDTSGFPYQCTVLAQQPKEVVIMGGWNNFFQGNTGNTALSDIGKMVNMAQAKGIKVIVCTLYAYDPAHPASWMQPAGSSPVTFYDTWRNPLNQGIRNWGNIVSVVDLAADFTGMSGYTIDGVHPTDEGNNDMMNVIQQKL